MGKRTVLGRFIGPPDETLKQIGMVIVMAARLDYQRMQILERTAGVPVEESANLRRRTLTRRLKDSVRREPLNRLEIKLNEWLREVNDLTGHPRLARPLRDVPPGLGRWSQEHVVDRLDDAGRDGWRLMMDLGTLAHDEAAYDANLKVREQVEAQWAEMDAEAARLREAGG